MNPLDNPEDLQALKTAVALLESPSFTIRVANMLGAPVEWAMDRLPDSAAKKIQEAIHAALGKAVNGALRTMVGTSAGLTRPRTHTALVAATGAVCGFFGSKGTFIELQLTTTIIMRSEADIGHSAR